MDKNTILSNIKKNLDSGLISKEDIAQLLSSNVEQSVESTGETATQQSSLISHSKNFIHVLYGIGALIVLIGVIILIAQNWQEIGFAGRIFVTLGIAVLAYGFGYSVSRDQHMLSQVLFTISAVLAPFGLFMIFDEFAIEFTTMHFIVTNIFLALVYGVTLWTTKKDILLLFTLGFATMFYYASLAELFSDTLYPADLIKWATIVIGLTYISVAYTYQHVVKAALTSSIKEQNSLQNLIYGIGAVAILGASFSFDGLFNLLMILLIFGVFYLSVFVKSALLLFVGSFFLIAHIIKLTTKYFADFISWPIALIGTGMLIIGVGYMTYYINKNLIKMK